MTTNDQRNSRKKRRRPSCSSLDDDGDGSEEIEHQPALARHGEDAIVQGAAVKELPKSPNEVCYSYVRVPKYRDVLLGRGREIQSSNGNFLMREITKKHRAQYCALPRANRRAFSEQVLDDILGTGARFLGRITNNTGAEELWREVSREVAHKKVSHSLREKPSQNDIQSGERLHHQLSEISRHHQQSQQASLLGSNTLITDAATRLPAAAAPSCSPSSSGGSIPAIPPRVLPQQQLNHLIYGGQAATTPPTASTQQQQLVSLLDYLGASAPAALQLQAYYGGGDSRIRAALSEQLVLQAQGGSVHTGEETSFASVYALALYNIQQHLNAAASLSQQLQGVPRGYQQEERRQAAGLPVQASPAPAATTTAPAFPSNMATTRGETPRSSLSTSPGDPWLYSSTATSNLAAPVFAGRGATRSTGSTAPVQASTSNLFPGEPPIVDSAATSLQALASSLIVQYASMPALRRQQQHHQQQQQQQQHRDALGAGGRLSTSAAVRPTVNSGFDYGAHAVAVRNLPPSAQQGDDMGASATAATVPALASLLISGTAGAEQPQGGESAALLSLLQELRQTLNNSRNTSSSSSSVQQLSTQQFAVQQEFMAGAALSATRTRAPGAPPAAAVLNGGRASDVLIVQNNSDYVNSVLQGLFSANATDEGNTSTTRRSALDILRGTAAGAQPILVSSPGASAAPTESWFSRTTEEGSRDTNSTSRDCVETILKYK